MRSRKAPLRRERSVKVLGDPHPPFPSIRLASLEVLVRFVSAGTGFT
jgi:hypothetical protein